MRFTFKLVLFGDGGVGKTSLVERFVKGTFTSNTQITIGVAFLVKRLVINGDPVDLSIWDFGGEERFRFLLPSYCRGVGGAIFMYDVTSPQSLIHLEDWLPVVRSQKANLPILALGTKSDLESQRHVMLGDASAFVAKYNIPDVMEVSAKTGQNVSESFSRITKLMIENIFDPEMQTLTPLAARPKISPPRQERTDLWKRKWKF
ncbi:MAG: small GTP-binding protein [Promethearchaeota archaeon CR_4]|nr:MAG: small GTP-binding protein [Candidatus Lokiarchaeota archaeon CR_4]